MSALWVIAHRELQEGFRNRWVISSIVLLGLLALLLVLLGSTPTGSVKASALAISVVNLASLSVYLLPLLGLLLGFDALVGEHERGTLALLLTYPVQRWQIVIGKLLGHSIILALALLIGYGGAGMLLAIQHGASASDSLAYVRLLGSSLLLGMVFLGFGHLLSAIVRERATAVGAALGLWLGLVVLYDLALLGALIADQGKTISARTVNNLLLVNPTDAYRIYNLAATESVSTLTGLAGSIPDSGNPILVVLGLWLVLSVAATVWLLQQREL